MKADRAPKESGFFARQDLREAPGRGRVAKLRAIARGESVLCVEGRPFAPSEAQSVMAVYDALSGPEARHTFMSPLDVGRVAEWARKLLSPSSRRGAA